MIVSSRWIELREGLSGPARRSSADCSKFRRALLGEGLDAFLDLLAAHAVPGPAGGRPLIKLAARDFVDGALHAAHRDRRVTGQDGDEPVDLLVQRFDWHHRGEIA